MTRGGARSRSGPAPDPLALRRERDRAGWLRLPAAGREGPPPPWPLVRPTASELRVWSELWALPQAVEWERWGEEYAVAMLVRTLRKAERPGSPVGVQGEVRRYLELLGLAGSLARNRHWSVEEPVARNTPTRTGARPGRDRAPGPGYNW